MTQTNDNVFEIIPLAVALGLTIPCDTNGFARGITIHEDLTGFNPDPEQPEFPAVTVRTDRLAARLRNALSQGRANSVTWSEILHYDPEEYDLLDGVEPTPAPEPQKLMTHEFASKAEALAAGYLPAGREYIIYPGLACIPKNAGLGRQGDWLLAEVEGRRTVRVLGEAVAVYLAPQGAQGPATVTMMFPPGMVPAPAHGIFDRLRDDGDVDVLDSDGCPATRLDVPGLYPVGSDLSVRYEHAEGIVISRADARRVGLPGDNGRTDWPEPTPTPEPPAPCAVCGESVAVEVFSYGEPRRGWPVGGYCATCAARRLAVDPEAAHEPAPAPEPPEAAEEKKVMHEGYVRTNDGTILVQIPDDQSRFGFYLADDDQTWDGGLGVATEWEIIPVEQVDDETMERLGWLLDDVPEPPAAGPSGEEPRERGEWKMDLRKLVEDALVASNAALESFCSARDIWAAAERSGAPEAPALEREREGAWAEYERRWREYNVLYYHLREMVMKDAPVIFC